VTHPSVLFVDQSGQPGGAELCLLDTVARLAGQHRVCTFADGPFPDALRAAGVTTTVLAAGGRVHGVAKDAGLLAKARSAPATAGLVRRVTALARQHDLVWANTQKAFVVSAPAAWLARRPLVWHLHDILSADHFSPTNRKLVVALANRFAARVVANSKATADAFVACGGRGELTRVIPNGIDAGPFDAVSDGEAARLRDDLGLAGVPVLGLFGRFAPWKGQEIAIGAMTHLPGVHLLLVGDALFGEDECKTRILSLIDRHGLADRVHRLGFRHDVPAVMKACDVVLHCSTAPEPFGRVIVEGMLAGRPVIATAAGGAAEILVDGRTGLLIPGGDAGRLASSVRRLLDDPAATQAMAARGAAEARATYRLDAIVHAVEREVSEVARTSRASARRKG
jgi:glycosyltransferase involved in cell wall biosynthesis